MALAASELERLVTRGPSAPFTGETRARALPLGASPGGASPGGASPGGASPGGASPGGASLGGALLGGALSGETMAAVDALLPDGGLPRGAVVEVASPLGLGRSTSLAIAACASAQRASMAWSPHA